MQLNVKLCKLVIPEMSYTMPDSSTNSSVLEEVKLMKKKILVLGVQIL